jgi:hypothetical protein
VGTAVLIATAQGDDGGPAAALAYEHTTLLGRLLEQLHALGIRHADVITRPDWAPALEPHTRGHGISVQWRTSADVAGDLRTVEAIARSGGGGLVVANAEILTQGEALAGLLADPRVATGMLTTTVRGVERYMAFRTRARRGRVVSASTPYHYIHRPNGTFLGVLKIAPPDRAAVADVAGRMAALVDGELPEGWTEEVHAKAGRWKLTLYRRGLAGTDQPGADEEEIELTPEAVELSPEDEAELARRLAAARQDVPSLLLCGLVRSGVQVGGSHLRELFWTRPLTPADVAAAAEQIGAHDEERALLNSAVKANDGFFTTFFVSPYSKYVARWAARRGWTPNQVTALSMLVGLLAAAAFATGERAGLVGGAILLQLAFTLDCVDGQLARYTRTFSAFGAWLDSIFDRAKEYVVFAGLAVGAAHTGDDVWLLAAAALTLQTVRHTMDFSFNIAQDEAVVRAVTRPLEAPPRARPGRARSREAPVVSGASRPARRYSDRSTFRWIAKIMAFPIGERFAAISITAALFDARVTFIVLLALGAFAAVYRGAGRFLRSLDRRGPTALARGVVPDPNHHAALRDDGPLARMLGRLVGRRLAIPPILIVTAGAMPMLVIAAITGDGASWGLASGAVAWAVLLGGVSSGRPLRDRLRWAVAPVLRVIEYGGVLWLSVLAGASTVPAGFAFLCAITFRHYDAFYRSRQRGDAAPRWIADASGGWEGRVIVALVLTAAGAVPAGLYIAATMLAAMLVGESMASWIANRRAATRTPLDHVEDAA